MQKFYYFVYEGTFKDLKILSFVIFLSLSLAGFNTFDFVGHNLQPFMIDFVGRNVYLSVFLSIYPSVCLAVDLSLCVYWSLVS